MFEDFKMTGCCALFPLLLLAAPALSGISIPRQDCRWLSAPAWGLELKCDGDEVAVGACSGGKHMVLTLTATRLQHD